MISVQCDCDYVADKGVYQRVGEATELALRVLTEKVGLLGYASHALDGLSTSERASYCNDHWQQKYKKVRKRQNPFLLPMLRCSCLSVESVLVSVSAMTV